MPSRWGSSWRISQKWLEAKRRLGPMPRMEYEWCACWKRPPDRWPPAAPRFQWRLDRPMASLAEQLIHKAERREALFGIIGLGYVGLPLAVELANAGYRILGFDVSQRV